MKFESLVFSRIAFLRWFWIRFWLSQGAPRDPAGFRACCLGSGPSASRRSTLMRPPAVWGQPPKLGPLAKLTKANDQAIACAEHLNVSVQNSLGYFMSTIAGMVCQHFTVVVYDCAEIFEVERNFCRRNFRFLVTCSTFHNTNGVGDPQSW